MNSKQIGELVLSGKRLSVVELRKVSDAQKYDAKLDPKTGNMRSESHFLEYVVITNDDSAKVKLYSPRGATAAPAPLKFRVGQRAVVVGDFGRGKYGLECQRAELIDLVTE